MKIYKKFIYLFLFLLLTFASYGFFIFLKNPAKTFGLALQKTILVNDNALLFTTTSSSSTVGTFLEEKNIKLNEHDEVIPAKNTTVHSGMQIIINRALKINLQVDGRTIESYSTAKTVGAVLAENKISLGRLDRLSHNLFASPPSDSSIIVTRINIEEKIIPQDINFKTITNTDSKLGWREEKITQTGEKGILEVKYRITYKNGLEISRVVLEKNIIQEPITQIVTQGTYMKLKEATRGQGTWYAYMGGMFAASTTIPKGSYAKVTNLANNKSIVVQINDYGPQGKGRIIDLDKIAFQKIAPLGAGVIGVKVEQILN